MGGDNTANPVEDAGSLNWLYDFALIRPENSLSRLYEHKYERLLEAHKTGWLQLLGSPEDADTLLDSAARHGNCFLVNALLSEGVDIELALYHAAKNGHDNVVSVIVANINDGGKVLTSSN